MRLTIKPANQLLHKGGGPVYEILSRIIKLFYWWWDGWGWHMSWIVYIEVNGEIVDELEMKSRDNHLQIPDNVIIMIAEAQGRGFQVRELTMREQVRVYNWFPEPPHPAEISEWIENHLGWKYDSVVYFWTGLQRIMQKFHLDFITSFLGRIINKWWMCWEAWFAFARDFGKPVQEEFGFTIRRYPFITDWVLVAEKDRLT